MTLQRLQNMTVPGNSPVKDVPRDYYPKNAGFSFTLTKGPDTGKKMFVLDHAPGGKTAKATVVFVHGNPESSYTFRHVVRLLMERASGILRIIAMDHIGFGLSDVAEYEMVCMDHADNLHQLIQCLDMDQVTLVIHDWGGPIGIGAFLKEYRRVSGLVILNSTVFPMPETGKTYRNYPISWLGWSNTPFVIPDRHWGAFSAYAIFRTPVRPAVLLWQMIRYIHRTRLRRFTEKDSAAYKLFREQFQAKGNVKSSKRLVRQSAVWGHGSRVVDAVHGRRDTTPFYRSIQDKITAMWGPDGMGIRCGAVLGGWDPLAKDDVIAQWIDHLPQLKGHVKRFDDAGHFIEETHAADIVEAICNVAELE